jgi:SAM-dependent methyltransferase
MCWPVLLPNLAQRIAATERMDDPNCDAAQLTRTLNAFARSNRLFTRYRSILRRWIIADMQRAPARRHRVVDLGAGGCDIAVWLLEQCRHAGLRVAVVALDANPRVVAYARQKYGHVAGLDIRHEDALGFNSFTADDYVFGNHFLHHLGNDEIVALLRELGTLPLRRFVFSDLLRRYHAYYLHTLTAAVLFPGTFIGFDGCLSIRKGFTVAEMEALLTHAGIRPQTQIHTLVPARIVLVGEGGQPH